MDRVFRNRTFVTLAVVLLLATAGCAGGAQLGDGGDGGGGDAPAQSNGGAPEPATDVGGEGDSGSDPAQLRQRAVIRTGQVDVRVEDFDAAERNLTRGVEAYGGFVSDSQVEVDRVDNATYRSGRLVLRVPRENFSAMMSRARAVGELQSSDVSSEDVTDRLVDIGARLENLRAERDRLRELYRNASDTEDVLAVEERLSEVQGEIERLEARQQSLQRQVALSTIRVHLHEPRPDPGPLDTDRWFDTPVVTAFVESVDGVVTSLRALVVAAAYVLPYAVIYGPLLVGVGYGVRRLRRRDTDVPVPDALEREGAGETDAVSDGATEPAPADADDPISEDEATDAGEQVPEDEAADADAPVPDDGATDTEESAAGPGDRERGTDGPDDEAEEFDDADRSSN